MKKVSRGHAPLLDTDRRRRDVYFGGAKVASAFRHSTLVCARSELAHLRRGQYVVIEEGDLVNPLDTRTPIPPWNDETHRVSVIRGKGHTVHACGEEGTCLAELCAGKDPTRTKRGFSMTRCRVFVEAADPDLCVLIGLYSGALKSFEDGAATPRGSAYKTVRRAITRALQKMYTHLARFADKLLDMDSLDR